MWQIFKRIFGDENSKTLKKYQKIVDKINELEPEIKSFQDIDFIKKTLLILL